MSFWPPNSSTALSLTHTSMPQAVRLQTVPCGRASAVAGLARRLRLPSITRGECTARRSSPGPGSSFRCCPSICCSVPPANDHRQSWPLRLTSDHVAPIASSGCFTRPIGRRLRLASPMKRPRQSRAGDDTSWLPLRCCRYAAAVEDLRLRCTKSLRYTRPGERPISGPSGGMSTPSARSTPAVECTSADWQDVAHARRPSPSAPNISARWEMDLSPGTRSSPATWNARRSAAILPRRSRGRCVRRGISR